VKMFGHADPSFACVARFKSFEPSIGFVRQ
jgi:hypothetical protein